MKIEASGALKDENRTLLLVVELKGIIFENISKIVWMLGQFYLYCQLNQTYNLLLEY